MNSSIETIALESSDEEEVDPLRISPLPDQAGCLKRNPLFGVTITPLYGPSTTTGANENNNNKVKKRIKPITLSEALRRSPTPSYIKIVEPDPLVINIEAPTKSVVESVPLNKPPVISLLFKKFTDACRNADASDDMTTGLHRVTKRYIACDKTFTYSKHFIRFLEGRTKAVLKDHNNVYIHLAEVLDELKFVYVKDASKKKTDNCMGNSQTSKRSVNDQPSTSKAEIYDKPSTSKADINDQPSTSKARVNGKHSFSNKSDNSNDDSEEEVDPDEKRRLEKYNALRKTLKAADKKARELEMKEVDWDDDEDSSYIQLQRYRDRCINIHRKMCELKGQPDNKSSFRPRVNCKTQFPTVNKSIEKCINKATDFPDFADIYKIIQHCNDRDTLNLTPGQLKILAKETFEQVGDQMQKQRQTTDWNLLSYFLEETEDPADSDPQLCAKLAENQSVGKVKLQEVLTSYVLEQERLKLEPEEVSEDDSNASDGSEDDDDEDDDNDGDYQNSNSADLCKDLAADQADVNNGLLSVLGLTAVIEEPEAPITSFLNEKTGLIESVDPIVSVQPTQVANAVSEIEDSDVAVAAEMEISNEADDEADDEDAASPSLLEHLNELIDEKGQQQMPVTVPSNNCQSLDTKDNLQSSELEDQILPLEHKLQPPNLIESEDDSVSNSNSKSPCQNIDPFDSIMDTELSLDLESLISPTIIPKLDDNSENVMFVSTSLVPSACETALTHTDQSTESTLFEPKHSAEVIENEITVESTPPITEEILAAESECDAESEFGSVEPNGIPIISDNLLSELHTTSEQKHLPTIVALSNNIQCNRKSVIFDSLSKSESSGNLLNKPFMSNFTNPIDLKLNVFKKSMIIDKKQLLSTNKRTNSGSESNLNTCARNGISKSSDNNSKRPRIDDDIITLD